MHFAQLGAERAVIIVDVSGPAGIRKPVCSISKTASQLQQTHVSVRNLSSLPKQSVKIIKSRYRTNKLSHMAGTQMKFFEVARALVQNSTKHHLGKRSD